MPARSCQCPERRAPIASRQWEICSKPGDGTAIIRCKACGTIWTTNGKFVASLPYDIGPVAFMSESFQHSRCDVALTCIASLLLGYREPCQRTSALKRLWEETWAAVEACRPCLRKRKYSREEDLYIRARYSIIDHYLDDKTDWHLGYAEMFLGADTYLCSTIGLCPKFASGPEWQRLRKMMDRWSEGWLETRPDAEEGGQLFYEELVA